MAPIQSSVRFPFLSVGEVGVYNISAGNGSLGIEIRPIPQDDIEAMMREVRRACADLELHVDVMEGGVECPRDNPHLASLLDAVHTATGSPARVSRKRPGTSARFAPGGNAIVWGQTGIGPHSRDERHFIPSIEPYLEILDVYADRLQGQLIQHHRPDRGVSAASALAASSARSS